MNSTAYIHSMKPSYIALRYIITKSSNVLCFIAGKEKSLHGVFQAKSKNRVKTTDLIRACQWCKLTSLVPPSS